MKTLDKTAFEALDTDLKALYQEKDGAYHLAAVPRTVNNGILEAKRQAEAAAEALKAKYGDLDPEVARKALDRLKAEEQEKALKAGEFEKVLGQTKAEKDAELNKLKSEYEAKLTASMERESRYVRDDAVTKAALEAGVLKEAIDDVKLHAAMSLKVNDGKLLDSEGKEVNAAKWLKDLLAIKKHWLGASLGGGTSKSGESNGSAPTHGLKRSTMTTSQKSEYTRKHGREAYEKLPYK